ncbi:hypothetical protein N7457_009571 [Penicillium paradoxum]|uniref:uncharacterized protein n=1 Tax=Penicillium paradoxum TaxID=176176 RepID=UPI00254870B1|nr:uncharacterized protein N7457_009571 [Penicillium paradoxum]KAJ5774675.1 hypothetical protein N7457_009571 [Penicillium paradoxum]
MAPSHSFILFLSFVLSPLVLAAPWIVTDYYEEVTTSRYYYGLTTEINQISPTATLPDEALSTITSTETDYDYTVIEKLYPTGYGVDRPYNNYYDISVDRDGKYHTTVYKVNLTFSAPTACSTQWTTTTAVEITPPADIRNLLPRETVVSSTSVDNDLAFQPTTYIYEVVFVEPTQLPSSSLSQLSSWNSPTGMYQGEGCRPTGSSDGFYGGSYEDGYYYSGYGYWDDNWWFTSKYGLGLGISGLAITLICLLGWIGIVFICGMIEAWVRFRRLMTGWQTRRGLPLFWAFILLPFSLFFLFCFRKGYRARSKEDAAILRQRWEAMGFMTKLGLFFAWGFRFKYPTVLGPAPARVAGSKRPKESGPRLLDATPPTTNPPSRAGTDTGVAPAGPEMAQASDSQAQPRAPAPESGVLPAGHDEEAGHAR